MALKLDPGRLATLDVCAMFNRPDVDAFLAETDADQFAEWQAYIAFRPQGWQANQMIVRRLTWAIFQNARAEKLDERKMGLKTAAEAALTPEQNRISDEIAFAKWDADSQKEVTDGQGN